MGPAWVRTSFRAGPVAAVRSPVVADQEGKLAVVTGGTRGIGAAVAERLHADGFRCLLTGTAPDRPPSAPQLGDYVGVDLGDRASTSRFAAVLGDLRPDVLVNNAGINITGPTTEAGDDVYDRTLEVNLRAPFALVRAVLPGMVERGWGRIVNVTSIWGVTGNSEDAAYCASKFGLDGLTVSVAAEVARAGVLVNAVAPGYIRTDLLASHHSVGDLAAVSARIPVGRAGEPAEIAALVSWLVSTENTYLTGQNLVIDGGLTRTG
jgi:NAD(P)-dependent dehydrogenase (short-subunit alcohol dehydrogenase family)